LSGYSTDEALPFSGQTKALSPHFPSTPLPH